MAIQSAAAKKRRKPASELESHLGYWLRFVSNHVSHGFRLKVEARGVTVSEWVVLREMLRIGPASPGELVLALGMSKGAVSKLVNRLQDKALASRAVLESDRRNHEVELTAAGRALVPRLARLADENDAEFFGHLAPRQRAALTQAMKDIARIHQLKGVPVD